MHFRPWLRGLLLSCLAAQVAFSQRRPVQQAPPRPAYLAQLASFEQNASVTRVALKNGMRVLVQESHSAPVASILTLIKSGRADEPPDIEGISTLLQRVTLRYSSGAPGGELASDLRFLGGQLKASVEDMWTLYEIVAPSMQWKKALELQNKLLTKPEWGDDELARERELLADEIRHSALGADEKSLAQLLDLAYSEGRRSRFVGPPPDALAAITPVRAREYAQKTYTPDRTILIVAGDVITSDVLTQVVQFYGRGPKPAAARRAAPPEPGSSGFRYRQLRVNTALPTVRIGFRVAPVSSPDYPILEILRAILGVGESSVLHRRLRDARKVILRGSCDLIDGAEGSLLYMVLRVDSTGVDRAQIATFTELELLKRQKPEAEEVSRAVAQLVTAHWSGLQTVSERAGRLAEFEGRGDWKGAAVYADRLHGIRPEDVQRVAQRYLSLENAVIVESLPIEHEDRRLDQESALALLKGLLKPATEQEAAEREKETRPEYDLPSASAAFKPSELNYEWRKASILRGPELFIREDHTQPVVYMGFFYPGGLLSEDQDNSGLTALMLQSLLQGESESTAVRRHRQLEIYGARIEPVVDEDYFGMTLAIASDCVERALELLLDMFGSPKLQDDEIARQREILLENVRRQRRDLMWSARADLFARLFRGHPYGLPPRGTEKSLGSLTPGDVRAWYDRWVRLKKPVVVIHGDTRGTSLAEFFVRRFSGSRFQEITLPKDFPTPPEKAETLEQTRDGGRALILQGFQLPPFGDEDFYPMEVLREHIAAGAPGYFRRVQEQQGRAYSLSVDAGSWAKAGWLMLSASGGPNDAPKLAEALADETRRYKDLELSYREYRSARNSATARLQMDRQQRWFQIRELARSIASGKGMEEFLAHEQRIGDVRQEDMPEAAGRFIQEAKSVTVILRPGTAP